MPICIIRSIFQPNISSLLCSIRRKSLFYKGFRSFLPVSTIISTIIEFQMAFDSATRTCSKAVFLCSRYSILADQLFQPVGSLLLHVLVAVTIDVKGEGDCRMAQRFGQGLRIDVALQGQRGECVP